MANTSLRTYAHNLLHFIRWWESVHPTGDVREGDLTESTLLDYVKFQSSQQPRPSPSTINDRVPVRVVEQTTGRGVCWINRYLDREYVRRVANTSLRTYAHNLLHFIRWWESVHPTGDVREGDLTESTLLDYVKFQSSQQPRPSPSTINDRVAVAERAIRNEFPNAPCQIAHGFHQPFLRRRPMGLGRPRADMSRLRVKVPKRNIVPLSVEEVARFWSSFRSSRTWPSWA